MRLLAVLCLTCLPATGWADPDLRLPPIFRTVLPNGMGLVVAEDHELPLVGITVFVGAGTAQDPPEQPGLAQLTADTLLRGAGRWDAPALARAVGDLGGTIEVTKGSLLI